MAKRMTANPISADSLRNWHRLFGLLLTSHLEGSPFTVELEKDLSIKQQRLDVVIVRRQPGELARPLPDGLEDLVDHNLITFKSHREPLDDWALKELTSHYVNYRKQVSPPEALLPESVFGLFAVCARMPRDLFSAAVPEKIGPGVYSCRRGSDTIRIVVAAELPKTKRNAMLHLFSAAVDQVQYGAENYRLGTTDLATIVNQLFLTYRREGLTMPYTMEDFRKDIALEVLDQLTPEQRMAGLPPEQRMAGLPPEQRMAGLPPEQRMAGLPPEEVAKRLTPEQRMAGLSPEQIEKYLKDHRTGSSSSRVKKVKPKDKP